MIEWYKIHDNRFEGYDDGTFVLLVTIEDTCVWEYIPGLWAIEGYSNPEEAMQAANEWYSNEHKTIDNTFKDFDIDIELEDIFDDWEDEWKNFCGQLEI